jgi:SNF2 family DNA or RNA helicase
MPLLTSDFQTGIGQRNPVKVHRILVGETVEDRIITLQEKKRELVDSALDENAGKSIGRLGTRELSFLFVRLLNLLDPSQFHR